jgi:hypothetical protein
MIREEQINEASGKVDGTGQSALPTNESLPPWLSESREHLDSQVVPTRNVTKRAKVVD